MTPSPKRKVLDYIGMALGWLGFLIIIGSVAAWMFGPEFVRDFYERTKPVIPFFLTGLGLVVLSVILSPGMRGPGPAASRADAGVRCGKCGRLNDGDAKFCSQCGTAV